MKQRLKQLKRLEQQYQECMEGDKYANDEERIMYEESSTKMLRAIEILKVKEKENFVLNYARDVKLAFGQKEKKVDI